MSTIIASGLGTLVHRQIQIFGQPEVASLMEKDDHVDRLDRAFIAKIVERDVQAMETFYDQYKSRVIPFLHRLTHDETIIEEAYNDVMLKVWDKAHQYKGDAKVSSWVFTIAYRLCLRVVTKDSKRRIQETPLEPSHDQELEENDTTPIEELADIVRQLPPKQRLAIELCYFEGYSLEEISKIARCPVNTVKTRLHHARLKLGQMMAQKEVDYE